MFLDPTGHKCKNCRKDAIAFHPYIGYCCKKCLEWAQQQYCLTESPKAPNAKLEPEYYI